MATMGRKATATTRLPATWRARPGWGITDAPYSCYDRDGDLIQRRVYMKLNQNLTGFGNLSGLFYRSVLGEGV